MENYLLAILPYFTLFYFSFFSLRVSFFSFFFIKYNLKTQVFLLFRNYTCKLNFSYHISVWYVNASQVVRLGENTRGKLSAPNWPGSPPSHTAIRTRLFAPHGHTLSAAFARTTLVPAKTLWPCGQGKGWIEVRLYPFFVLFPEKWFGHNKLRCLIAGWWPKAWWPKSFYTASHQNSKSFCGVSLLVGS